MTLYTIGLDGLTFDLVDRWRDDLDTLDELIEEGAAHRLRSVHPPITGPAWMSIYTGLDPSVFNRYHFNYFDSNKNAFDVSSRSNIEYPYFWEPLEDRNICLLNLPMTYPPSDEDQTIVCGYMGSPGSVVTSPPSLRNELKAEIDGFGFYDLSEDAKRTPERFMKEGTVQFRKMQRAWAELDQREPWDLFMAQFSLADWGHHYLWEDMEANPDDCKLKDVYVMIDDFLGDIRDRLSPSDNLVLISDHGGGKREGTVYLNETLRQYGHLSLKDDDSTDVRRTLKRIGVTKSRIKNLDKLGVLNRVRDWIPGDVKTTIPSEDGIRNFKLLVENGQVDWEGTTAFALSGGLLYCEGDDGDIVDDVRASLSEHGLDVRFVNLSDEYRDAGPSGPDYVVYVEDLAYEVKDGLDPESIVDTDTGELAHQGSHRLDGVFIGHGPMFDADGQPENQPWLPDVAPTLLFALDEPIPEWVVGRPLLEFFSDSYLADHEPAFEDISVSTSGEDLSTEEAEKMNERLRSLGYLRE